MKDKQFFGQTEEHNVMGKFCVLGERMWCGRCGKQAFRLFFGVGKGSHCWYCRIPVGYDGDFSANNKN